MVTKSVRCDSCRNTFDLQVNFIDYRNWQNGVPVQRAMPYLSAAERELLISATCGKCWDEMFGEFE